MAPLSEHAFADLYRTAARPLWAYVYRVSGNAADSDEIVQEAFTRMLMADVGSLAAGEQRRYLFRVAANLLTDRWRRAERERAVAGAEPRGEPSHGSEPRDDSVAKTFARLTGRERALLWLAYVEEESHEEIAGALHVKPGSVKVLLSRARARLRRLLQEGAAS